MCAFRCVRMFVCVSVLWSNSKQGLLNYRHTGVHFHQPFCFPADDSSSNGSRSPPSPVGRRDEWKHCCLTMAIDGNKKNKTKTARHISCPRVEHPTSSCSASLDFQQVDRKRWRHLLGKKEKNKAPVSLPPPSPLLQV